MTPISEDPLELNIKITAVQSLASSGGEQAAVSNIKQEVLEQASAIPKKKRGRPRRNLQSIKR